MNNHHQATLPLAPDDTTHLAVATHNAGPTDVDGHLARIREYMAAVR